MNRARSWGITSAITTLVLVLGGAVALGDLSVRDSRGAARGVDAHDHVHPQVGSLRDLEPSMSAPAAGTMLSGGELISHFEGGRNVTSPTGGGRIIYTGTLAVEPTIGIDKKSNIFYQGAIANGLILPVVVVSRDGGLSWDKVTPVAHPHTQDPLVYVDTDTGRSFTADLTFPCTTVSHTDDVGQSWRTSQACGLVDHQNLSAGPPVASPTVGYPNIVYMCAIDMGDADASFALSCLKSLDGGITWIRTGAPAFTADPTQDGGMYDVPGWCGGGSGHSFVDSKGILYVPKGWCGQPYLAISKDEGATWERVQVAENGMPRGVSRTCAGTCRDLPFSTHETAVTVDMAGNIYYFWVATNRLPYLAISRDGGKSFSKPIMVGPLALTEAWGPTIDVGDVGKVALGYVGSTNAPGGKSPDGTGEEYTDAVTWNGYVTTTTDALSQRPRFFTASVNHPSDPIMRGECAVLRCGVQFDFIDVVIGPDGRPWTSMVDGCPAPGDSCDIGPLGAGFVGTVTGGPKLR